MASTATERVRVIGPGQSYIGKQGFTYHAGASAETVGAERICMNVLPMPAGTRAKVHFHRGIETIAYLLEGTCSVYFGERLERRATVRAGDHVFIPADVLTRSCSQPSSAGPRRPESIHPTALRGPCALATVSRWQTQAPIQLRAAGG